MIAWNPWALPGLAALVLGLILAGLVWRAAPERSANRRLALLLALDGVALGAQFGLQFVMTTENAALLMHRIAGALVPIICIQYLAFVATLETPLARVLRIPAVQWAGAALASAAVALIVLRVEAFLPFAVPTRTSPWQTFVAPPMQAVYGILGVVSFYGLAVAVSAYRRAAPGSAARRKAKAYALAFGVRDAGFLVFGLLLSVALNVRFGGELPPESADLFIPLPFIEVAFIALMAYGILRTHLFDIDLRLKMGVSRGTAVSIFLVVVFVVAKVVETYLNRAVGFVAGSVVAGMLLFLVPKLNKIGERVADTALPQVQPTSAYVTAKKIEVYRAAVEAALEDGSLDDRDRSLLARLQARLGITDVDAQAVESEVHPAAATT